MKTFERYGTLAARILIAVIFVASGVAKLLGPEQTAAFIASKGLPLPMAGALFAGLLELVGGLLLVVGLQARWSALALGVFLVPVTVIFHNPVGLSGMEAQMQQVLLMKNLAIIGGLLSVAAFGAGPISLDARRRKAVSNARALAAQETR